MRATSAGDWSLWWGTFRDLTDARLHVWRCSDAGLNLGEPILVMTVADAHHRRLDDEAVFRAYLASRFGSGRYRITPRSDQGTKLPGTHSLVIVIAEDSTMLSPTTPGMPSITTSPMDHDTAIEIERMRLAAEMEREREARRERQREQREERRRERDQERERRRQEDRARRDEEDRRRSDHDAQTQTMLMQVLKEMAAGRSSANADPLVAAALAKLGQPDPLVLKLLDTHGKREELTDFFKVQAESMRMASTLQTDSLKQVMTASQDVQAQLLRQAADVARQREPATGWDGIGSVLSATAQVIGALRSPAVPASGDSPTTALHGVVEPAAVPPSVPETLSTTTDHGSRSLPRALALLRYLHQSGAPLSEQVIDQVIAALPSDVLTLIRQGRSQDLQTALLAVLAGDPALSAWMQQPAVAAWLVDVLKRIDVVVDRPMEMATTVLPAASRTWDDAII
jgi:hypothetical protein